MSSSERGYIDCNRSGHIRDVDGNPLILQENNHLTATSKPSPKSISVEESQWKVLFYIPNLMGYLRIILAFYGYQFAIQKQHNSALNAWIAASLLDLFDGIAARKLNQCSQFGILLDVIADNILRSIVWMSNITDAEEFGDASGAKRCTWIAIIFLEWITMACSQCKTNQGQYSHWKDMRQNDPPFWVQAVFKNNFRTIPGILAIYGLFVAPLGTYVVHADKIWPKQLLMDHTISVLVMISYVGRVLSAAVELWICVDYACDVINHEKGQETKTKAA
jgi:phosphatidylglycerophosphate synthase